MVHPVASLTPRRRRAREAKTERILDAATRILVAEGPAALTIARIADELDYTVGALYRYFDSKDALVAELERRVVADIEAAMHRAGERVGARMKARRTRGKAAALAPLVAVARVYQALPEAAPERFALVSQTLADPRRQIAADADARVLERLMPLLRRIADLFAAAAGAGALGRADPEERAMIYWAGLHGSVQLRKLDRLDAPFALAAGLVPATTRTLLCGWGAPRTSLVAAERLVDEVAAAAPFFAPDRPA